MNKQQLASKIWESANKMRSKIEANEYKDYILGFIFYKFLSEREVEYLKKNQFSEDEICELSEDDVETRRFVQNNLGYFISYENLFSTWLEKGREFNVSDVHDALSAFERLINDSHKKVFSGIFDTLASGLSKLGDTSGSQTKAISDLIQLIKDIPMSDKQDFDVLGFIYEYLISMFAANAGKKAGEFYTPHEVSLLMSEIVAHHLSDKNEIKIYDPTSGSGSLLINIGKAVAKHSNNEQGVVYYAQELKQNTYNLTRMNLIMRGISPDSIYTRNADTLEDDWPYFDESDPVGTYDPLYVDAVVSNPPYSQHWDPSDKDSDPRYAYGLAPKSKADYAFLLHDLFHLKPEGIMTIVLPHGVLFRGGEEGIIRKNLIENHNIEAIIGLPANIFFGTGIPTVILVLRQKRSSGDVLIIDASKHFIKEGKTNKLQASDIKRIVDVVTNKADVDKYSRLVGIDEIRENDYNLNIPRYVDSSEPVESWDIYASMFGGIPAAEVNALQKYWSAWPSLKDELFISSGEYYKKRDVDVSSRLEENSDVVRFKEGFEKALQGLPEHLRKRLIDNLEALSIPAEAKEIHRYISSQISDFPLIDYYKVYQVFDDIWTQIASDLEIIQTEGVTSIKRVDPNLVTKKKGGVDQEVQEGWAGRILPFELVQSTLLAEHIGKLNELGEKLETTTSTIEEIISEMSDEDKESEAFNEEKDGLVMAELRKAVREIDTHDMDEFESSLVKLLELKNQETSLKKEIKSLENTIHSKTKKTIEELGDDEALDLLEKKWSEPLLSSLEEISNEVTKDLASSVKAVTEKYSTTLSDVVTELKQAEKELADMIDDLTGSEFDMQGLAEFQSILRGA